MEDMKIGEFKRIDKNWGIGRVIHRIDYDDPEGEDLYVVYMQDIPEDNPDYDQNYLGEVISKGKSYSEAINVAISNLIEWNIKNEDGMSDLIEKMDEIKRETLRLYWKYKKNYVLPIKFCISRDGGPWEKYPTNACVNIMDGKIETFAPYQG